MPDSPRRRLPAFVPAPVRARKDGWTPARQCEFIRLLHVRPDIGKAAKAVGMSRRSAYRLRERPGAASFAAAWDAAFASRPPPASTNMSQLWYRAFFGQTKPIVRGGKQVGTITKPDNAAALELYDRLERMARNAARRRSADKARGERACLEPDERSQ